MRRSLVAALVTVTVPVLVAAQASRPSTPTGWWPHWRGVGRPASRREMRRLEWSDTSNVAWKVEIPGRGHSTPVIWGDRIFVTTASADRPAE